MKRIICSIVLAGVLSSTYMAIGGDSTTPNLVSLDLDTILKNCSIAIQSKMPDVNVSKMELVSLNYQYSPGGSVGIINRMQKNEQMSCSFIRTDTEKHENQGDWDRISYQVVNVTIFPGIDPKDYPVSSNNSGHMIPLVANPKPPKGS